MNTKRHPDDSRRTTGYFDKVSADYASWYGPESAGAYALRVRQALILASLDKTQARILDVGCGPGVLARALHDLGHEVWGIDLAAGMIEQCRQRFAGAHDKRFLVGDATQLDLPDAFFDVVICTGVIDFVDDQDKACVEMVRVAKPGGTLLIAFPNLLSPYAAWSKFVFFPGVALLRPLVYRFLRRPQPASLPLYRNRLSTPRQARARLRRAGGKVVDTGYFYFNPCLAPIDELFPRAALRITKALERLRHGWLRWIGVAFVVKAIKRAK